MRPPGPSRRAVLRAGLALVGGGALTALAGPRRAQAQRQGPDLAAEVCIIGSGPAGAVLALALAQRGIATLLVESGPERDTARDGRFAALDAYESGGEIAYPLAASRFRGAGGTSNLWTGACPRLYPLDFEPNPYTPAQAPWPLGYAELEPYYQAAEVELRVRGVADAPHAPPRRHAFPRPLPDHQPNLARLLRTTGADLAVRPAPYSDARGRPVNVAATHLPAFRALPQTHLLCGATATQLLVDAGRGIDGVRLEAFAEAPRTARARLYVIAGGGVETARLLLRSRSARWPDGVGNGADLVGRNFMEHPAVAFGRGSVEAPWEGGGREERGVTAQYVAAAKGDGLGGVRLRVLATPGDPPARRLTLDVKAEIELEPHADNRVVLTDARRDAFGAPGARLVLRFTANDQRTIRYARDLVRRTLDQLGVRDGITPAERPRWLHHHLGTCRMGDDPRRSVVDRDLRVHGVDNLYLASSAVFVTGGVSNPTLTIVALSLRLAEHLAARLRT